MSRLTFGTPLWVAFDRSTYIENIKVKVKSFYKKYPNESVQTKQLQFVQFALPSIDWTGTRCLTTENKII